MTTIDRWSVELSISEHDRETEAGARLIPAEGAHLWGHGAARRNPADPDVTGIGEKIAVARALSDLAHVLLESAAGEIEYITHERARLHL
jgi:Rv2632c-like